MKTKRIFVWALVFLAALFTAACPVDDKENKNVPPSEKTSEEDPEYPPLGPIDGDQRKHDIYVAWLLADYWLAYDSELPKLPCWTVWLEEYFGTYKGLGAVWIDGFQQGHTAAERTLSIGGTEFHYRSTNRILLWERDKPGQQPVATNRLGKFYELEEAYELGLLDENDIKSIAYYYNTSVERLPVNSPEPPPEPEPLSPEMVTRVLYYPEFPGYRSSYLHYYGTYNGYIALQVAIVGSSTHGHVTAGVPFTYPGPGIIEVWKDGQFYPLHTVPNVPRWEVPNAYELGFLSREDVRNIAYFWDQSINGTRDTKLTGVKK